MVEQVSETARASDWVCTAASAMAADRILRLFMILK
jgi:hypothetical protein